MGKAAKLGCNALLLASLATGCRACGAGSLSVGGEHPYERCLAAEPPPARSWSVGDLRLELKGRDLEIRPMPKVARIAVFSGPGVGPAPGGQALAALKAAKPQLMLLIGAVGDDQQVASSTLRMLAGLAVPTLVLAGGRDTSARLGAARKALGKKAANIVDISALRRIGVGDHSLIPLAGAARGLYTAEPGGCGYGLDDLKMLASDLGGNSDAPRLRWLVSWQAPASDGPHGVARAAPDLSLGDADLAEFGRRVGARGGLFAWPRVQAMRPAAGEGRRALPPGQAAVDLRLVVPSLAGPAIERDDGSHVVPGFALVELSEAGMSLLEQIEIIY